MTRLIHRLHNYANPYKNRGAQYESQQIGSDLIDCDNDEKPLKEFRLHQL